MQLANATVFYPPETNPNVGGGPIRRASGALVRSGEGMPPYGTPDQVLRTPHAVVYDVEAGGAVYPGLDKMMFLPDGRLVSQTAMDGAPLGANASVKVAWGVVVLGALAAGLFTLKVR